MEVICFINACSFNGFEYILVNDKSEDIKFTAHDAFLG